MKLSDIDLNKLAVFVEVVRAQGITAAAARLRLTPSAVSQSIKALELALGVALFERTGKSFSPSPAGQSLYNTMSTYQEGLAAGLKRLRRRDTVVRGHIRLGMFYGFSNRLAASFLAALQRDFPQLEVDVLVGAPSDLDRLVHAQRLDFAINLFRSAESLGLNDVALTSDELWLVSARKPEARSLGFDELCAAPFVDYYRNSKLVPDWIQHHFGRRVSNLPIVMHAAHAELVVQLILQGVGIGVVASSIARPHVEAARLFVIRGNRQQLVSSIWLKERDGVEADEVRTIFRERLLAHFGDDAA